ncbi:MAG: hypothetical protein WCH11_05135 [Bdellovibrio sp.]
MATVWGLGACGKSSKIFDEFQTRTELDLNQNLWLQAKLKLQLGLLVLPNLEVPIQTGGRQLGVVKLSSPDRLSIEANLTALSRDQLQILDRLPNGDPLPVSGLDRVYGIPIGSKSLVYFASQAQNTLLGLALIVPELDRIVAKLPLPAGFWLPLNSSLTSKGVAGVFSSPQTNSSGLGLFVSQSLSLIPNKEVSAAPLDSKLSGNLAPWSAKIQAAAAPIPSGILPSSGDQIHLHLQQHEGLRTQLIRAAMKRQVLSIR